MANNTSRPTFEYNGHLIYQPINIKGSDSGVMDLNSTLPGFSEGTSNKPGYGFEHIAPSEYIDLDGLAVDLKHRYAECDIFRYKRESFGDEIQVITEQGERLSASPVSVITGELVSTPNENLLFRGSQSEFQNMLDHLQQHISTHHRLKPLKFDSDYLLWIFWHCFFDKSIGTGDPLRLSKLDLQGGQDIFGQSIEYEGEDVTRSVVVLASILQDKSIESIGGLFDFSELYVNLDIYSNGRVHVRAAEDIRKSSQIVRFLSATQSADMIVESYLSWKKMPRKRRYPPQSFYTDLKDQVEEEGFTMNFSMSDAVRRTAKFRGEDI